jgi:predicted lipoprotein with Yx(FWY)xxD motif
LAHNDVSFSEAIQEPIFHMTRLTSIARGRTLAAAGGAVAIAAAASAVPAMASHPQQARAHAAAATKVSMAHTRAGTILVGPNGHTLYAFGKDTRKTDNCQHVRGCLGVWPMLTTSGSITAGPGVSRSMLGTIRVNGKRQVTYDGHPLYLYTGDDSRHDTAYIGIRASGGTWDALAPSGKLVTHG